MERDASVGAPATVTPLHRRPPSLDEQVDALTAQVSSLRAIVLRQDKELSEVRARADAKRGMPALGQMVPGLLFAVAMVVSLVAGISPSAPGRAVEVASWVFLDTLPWQIDSVLHFGSWMVAMILGGLMVRTRKRILALAVVLFGCGLAIEGLQEFVTESRKLEGEDIVANISGLIAGLSVLALLGAIGALFREAQLRWWRTRRQR